MAKKARVRGADRRVHSSADARRRRRTHRRRRTAAADEALPAIRTAIDTRARTVRLTDPQARAVADVLSEAQSTAVVRAALQRLHHAPTTERRRRRQVPKADERQAIIANPVATRGTRGAKHHTGRP